MNLLQDKWIPVQLGTADVELITLQDLLCQENDWQICLNRDDMELAALQLLVCLVQVIFMPMDKRQLLQCWQQPLSEKEYKEGIQPFNEWFDLLHPKYPFMQNSTIVELKGKKNWSSIQKLFVGLPESTSTSPSSSAFFNRIDEIDTVSLPDAAIAIFQQATNGFSLGGAAFSCGLKGSMPLTTLLMGKSIRESIWFNILTQEFLSKYAPNFLQIKKDLPVWVNPPKSGKEHEDAGRIGLFRGLFWQPAQIKLTLNSKMQVTGFVKQAGLCTITNYWYHPHTPLDMIAFAQHDKKKKPFLSAKSEEPLWHDLLSFFYSRSQFNPDQREGAGRALVVQQYQEVFARKTQKINLAVGGYVKGGSAESLAARKHELFGLDSNWDEKYVAMKFIVDLGVNIQQILNKALTHFGRVGLHRGKLRKKENKIFTGIKHKAKKMYFKNSETIMHSMLRNISVEDAEIARGKFTEIAIEAFDFLTEQMMENDFLILRAGLESRAILFADLKKMEG
jgi:CRISPR system Cascade subunit CasA